METLQEKVTELQEVTKNQQTDIELQVKSALKQKRFQAEPIWKARNIQRTLKEPCLLKA